MLRRAVLLHQVDPDELRRLKRVDAAAISQKQKLTEMDVLAVVQNDSTYLQVLGGGRGRRVCAGWGLSDNQTNWRQPPPCKAAC